MYIRMQNPKRKSQRHNRPATLAAKEEPISRSFI
jgi:hypothetical protein